MILKHPFTFVPFPKTLARDRWLNGRASGHERFHSRMFSGAFECKLITVAPLCIKDHFHKLHESGEPPFLPGSSLKGMLRNTMQILGFGCAGQQFQNKKAVEQENSRTIPDLELGHMSPCTTEEACLACKIFGYSVKKQGVREEDDAEPFGWAAKVRFRDSEPVQNWNENRWTGMNDAACSVAGHIAAMPQDQGPRHKAFYYPYGDGRPAGWKVYRHAKRVTRIADGYASSDCVKPGTTFDFRVEFENLSLQEHVALELTLTLSHTCAIHPEITPGGRVHKMGYGKGVGMGSCRVEIAGRENLDVRRFFKEPGVVPVEGNCDLALVLESEAFKSFCEARATSGGADLLVFPTWEEFKANPGKSIGDYDNYLARERPDVTFPQPPPPPPPPPKAAPTALPKTVRCRITSVKNSLVKGETVDEYNGHKYRFAVPSHAGLGQPTPQTEATITVDPKGVDHETHTFRGTRWAK